MSTETAPPADPPPALIRDAKGWGVTPVRLPDGRLVTIRCAGKGEATYLLLQLSGLVPTPARDDRASV